MNVNVNMSKTGSMKDFKKQNRGSDSTRLDPHRERKLSVLFKLTCMSYTCVKNLQKNTRRSRPMTRQVREDKIIRAEHVAMATKTGSEKRKAVT